MSETETFAAAVTAASKQILVEVIVETVYDEGLKLPTPIIRAAVEKVLDAAGELDLDEVEEIFEVLPVPNPIALARDAWDRFTGQLDESCEVECPESGDTITLDDGDGMYACPDCGQQIAVEDGMVRVPAQADQ